MKPIVLAILDGWGISPVWGGNAIEMNSPAHFNQLWRDYPHLILKSVFGRSDKKILANSEIGHMMIGSGRDIISDCELIDSQIIDPNFFNNAGLRSAIEYAVRYNSNLQIIQMVSEGCIHSSLRHLIAILNFCKRQNFNRVYVHAITDGRDVEEVSAGIYIKRLTDEMTRLGVGKIASIAGRFYGMDRDNHWERTSAYYKMITGKKIINKSLDPHQAIEQSYRNKISDEFIPPTTIFENGFPVSIIKNDDSIILGNFRSDRVRQLLQALRGYHKFGWFDRPLANIKLSSILKYHFAEYLTRDVQTIFSEDQISSTLPEILSRMNLKQLKVAESEKLAHVTYFLNGGVDQPYPGEDRKIIKSADVVSFNLDPKMKAAEITETIVSAVAEQKYTLIAANYANVDEVAHTGDIIAASKAVDAVDKSIASLVELVDANKITLIITADHGNGEAMVTAGDNRSPETFHTVNPVPFILADASLKNSATRQSDRLDLLTQIAQCRYSLKDVAPTILEMLKIEKPAVMTGSSLLPALRITWSPNENPR
jgi:2,3-bisphosphoglycerate-independent phosphoglycerate mutase